MANWEYIMECYESNDCESLGDYAVAHINKLMDYFESYLPTQEAANLSIFCGMYFISVDNFVDGGEEEVFRRAVGEWRANVNFLLSEYKRLNKKALVEREISRAPRSVKDEFMRLGCALCSGKGYISSDERRVILRWE